MKIALTCALLLSAAPLAAQTLPEDSPEEPGFFERGAEMLLRQFMDEMAPALDEAEQAFREMEPTFRAMLPMMRELAAMIGDIDHYHMPEKLPNGDILLRRKPDLPPEPESEPERPAPGGAIEL